MKKLMGAFLYISFFAINSHAAKIAVTVGDGTLQPGTTAGFHTSSGTARDFNTINLKSTGTWTLNGTTQNMTGAVRNGTVTDNSTGTWTGTQTLSSATITNLNNTTFKSSSGTICSFTSYSSSNTLMTASSGTIRSFTATNSTMSVAVISSATVGTLVNVINGYLRPQLEWVGVTEVQIATNATSASGRSILFPDGSFRTVSSTTNYRFGITVTAVLTGNKKSGLRTSLSEQANTWYHLYAVKATDNSTDFVVVGDTTAPTQDQYSNLNSFYGANGWVFLGLIPNGDNAGATSDIPVFEQVGAKTTFSNTNSGSAAANPAGIKLANSAGATSLSWSYAIGNTVGSQFPSRIRVGTILAAFASSAGSRCYIQTNVAPFSIFAQGTNATIAMLNASDITIARGIQIASTGSVAMDIYLAAFLDPYLANGVGTGF